MERFMAFVSHSRERRGVPRPRTWSLVLLAGLCVVPGGPMVEAQEAGRWIAPRTAHGHPDLQGNWSNATLTPIVRPPGVGPVLTPEQVRRLEGERAAFIEADLADSDPNRGPPPVGGTLTGDARWDAGAGAVGGYNQFFIDAGDHVAIYDGEARSSLIVDPPDGGRPPLTDEGMRRLRRRQAFEARFGEYDNPENRPSPNVA